MTTSNPRRYTISCQGKPTDTIAGNITCSAYDAAKNYVQEFLPGYTLISCNYRMEQRDEKYGLHTCLLYTSDAADDLLCVDLGGRRIIKKKKKKNKINTCESYTKEMRETTVK